jgi:mannose-6-phosphate isomerase-like protein (cupin superfamily)
MMDISKLGFRTIIGITLPGTILVLVCIYSLSNIYEMCNIPLPEYLLLKQEQILKLFLLFIMSYLVGSILRLNSADNLDDKSSKITVKRFLKRNKNFESATFTEWKEGKLGYYDILQKMENNTIDKKFDEIIWRYEKFPYPIWQFRKFILYHPFDTYLFFKKFKESMKIGPGGRGKEFFNYCKMVIHQSCNSTSNSVIQEITLAEALVRFYAGTYYGLIFSFWVFICLLSMQIIHLLLFSNSVLFFKSFFTDTYNISLFLAIVRTIIFTGAVYIMEIMIVRRFRGLRIKEVDTVYDALYLISKGNAEVIKTFPIEDRKISEKYKQREDLIKTVFFESKNKDFPPTISLDVLISIMKERCKIHNYLSSLYFAGNNPDYHHPYFLKNDNIAIGLSILPEDIEKTSNYKHHPHQTEIIFVISGSIIIEYDYKIKHGPVILEEGDHFIIEKGQCHMILPADENNAVFLFVKTNPNKEPRGKSCNDSKN